MISVIKPYPQSKVKSSSSSVDNEKRKIKKGATGLLQGEKGVG